MANTGLLTKPDVKIHFLEGSNAAPGSVWRPRLALYEQTPLSRVRSRPVLYLHGMSFPAASSVLYRLEDYSWADHLNGKGTSVWALDFAGYGRSERYPSMSSSAPPSGTPSGRATDVLEQIERSIRYIITVTNRRRIPIIAHSWGSIAAALFAQHHPDLIESLVLFAPFAQRTSMIQREGMHANAHLTSWRFITVDDQKKRFVEDLPPGHPPVLIEPELAQWGTTYLASDPTSMEREPPSVKTPNGPLVDVMSAWSGDLAYKPQLVSVPVGIVRGAWDRLSSEDDLKWLQQTMPSCLPSSCLTIPDATHLAHLEKSRLELYDATWKLLTALLNLSSARV